MTKTGNSQHFFLWLSIVAFIVLGTFTKSAHSVPVYLSVEVTSTWNGVCDHSQGCGSEMSPCKPSPVGPLENSADFDCDLVFVAGNWPQGLAWKNIANTNTHITFQVGFGVQTPGGSPMTIETSLGNLSITHHGLDTFSLSLATQSSNVNVSGDGPWKLSTLSITASNTAALVTIGGFSMVDMSIKMLSQIGAPASIHALLEDLDVTVSSTVTSPYYLVEFLYQNADYEYSLIVNNCSIRSSFVDEALITASISLNKTSFIDCEISNFRRIGYFPNCDSTNVTVQRSTLSGIGNTFLNGPANCIVYFEIIYSSVSSATTIELVQTAQTWFDISDSTISGFMLDRILHLSAFNSLIEDSKIHSTIATTFLQLIDTQVTCPQGSGLFRINTPPNSHIELIGANFSGCYFEILGSIIFSPLTNFTVDKLELNSVITVVIPSFTVTHAIRCTSYALPLSQIIAPPSGTSEWTLHSITADNVLLNLSTPNVLNIHVTKPSTGLQGINSGAFGNCPSLFNLFWDVPVPSNTNNITLIHPVASPLNDNVRMHVSSEHPGFFFGAVHSNDFLYCLIMSPLLPTPIPQSCPLPIPTGFTCVDGILISVGSIETPSISFPPNSGTVIINGNLTISDTITFQGIGSSINVTGCASVKEIEIDFSGDSSQHNPNSLPKTPVVLIQQASGCSNSLIETRVTVKQEKSCKSIKSNTQSDNRQLSVLFSLDTKKCNDKWIILGSVLGGTLVIAVILVFVFTYNQSAKNCIRPYARRGK